MRKNDLLLFVMLAAGTTSFVLAVIKRLNEIGEPSYGRPKGGEKVGDYEAFIG